MTKLSDQAPIPFDPQDDEHRVALARTGRFGEQAAGAIMLARSTGRFMLMERSEDVLESGTYGGCGGAHKKNEAADAAARREIGEETGWDGAPEDMVLIPALVYREPGFTYSNFIAVVPEEFDPIYGWEAVGHVWCTTADLPSPLHFGIEALLADPWSRELLEGDWESQIAPSTLTNIDFSIPSAPSTIDVSAPCQAFSTRRLLSEETTIRLAEGIGRMLSVDHGGPFVLDGTPTAASGPRGNGGGTSYRSVLGTVMDTVPGAAMAKGLGIDAENNRIEGGREDPVADQPAYAFTVVLEGDELPGRDVIDAIYVEGCDDSVLSFQNGEFMADFLRQGPSLREAVTTALWDLRAGGVVPIAVRTEDPALQSEVDGVLTA